MESREPRGKETLALNRPCPWVQGGVCQGGRGQDDDCRMKLLEDRVQEEAWLPGGHESYLVPHDETPQGISAQSLSSPALSI